MVKESKRDLGKARYSRNKNNKFVVSQQRTASELKQCQHPPWAHLPPDLLAEIMVKLSSADRVRFRNVCKSFLLPNHENRVVDELPWILSYDWTANPRPTAILCKLFDPYHHKPYSIHEFIAEEISGSNLRHDAYSRVCASKHGWLLLYWQKMEIDLSSFFLFSPFTKQYIILPDWVRSLGGNGFEPSNPVSTFSADPNSPGCVFFLLCNIDHIKITISTCKRGDTKWITLVFDAEGGPIADVTYSRGCFYCVSKSGSLARFTVDRLEWIHIVTIVLYPRSSWGRIWSSRAGRLHLLESNGEILLVILVIKLGDTGQTDKLLMWKFNWSRMAWDKKTSLEERALFLGCSSFAVSANGTTRDTADKVYYRPSNYMVRFYSLEDAKSHQCEASSSAFSGWLAPEPWVGSSIWIQPPQFPTNTDSK